jgi:hypothetical protein
MQHCNDEGVMLETEKVKDREINLLRGISYVFSVLSYLQDEPLCCRCDSFAESIETAKDRFLSLEKSVNKNRVIPDEIRRLLSNIYAILAGLTIPENTLEQDKTGNCTMPSEVCLATSALRSYEEIEKLTHNKEVLNK